MKEMKTFKVWEHEGYTRLHIISVSLKGYAMALGEENQNGDAEQRGGESRTGCGVPRGGSRACTVLSLEVSAFHKQEPTAKVRFLPKQWHWLFIA